MINAETFTLYGPSNAVAVSRGGKISIIDRPSLDEALLLKYPGCTIIDKRTVPDVSLVSRLADLDYKRLSMQSVDDFSPS